MERYSLLIAALVAVVAIVGLIVYFQGSVTGQAQHIVLGKPPAYRSPVMISNPAAFEQGQVFGETVSEGCQDLPRDRYKCCSNGCAEQCGTVEECFLGCRARCRLRIGQALSPYYEKY